MKKGQLLAALALAFALGVVAPVAGVYNSASSVYAAEARTEADGTEVKNAINYVKANSTYSKISAVKTAIADYGNDSLTATVSGVQGFMNTLNGANVNGTDDANGTISASYSNNDDLATLATKAQTITNYNLYSKYIKDLNADEFDIVAVRADVVAFRNAGIVPANTDLAGWEADGTVDTKSAVETALTGKIANLSTYESLIEAVKNINDYSEAYDAIYGAISAAVNADGKEAIKDFAKYTTAISALTAVATNDNIDGYTAWGTVIEKVEALAGYSADASTDNWTKVQALAVAYKAAVPVVDVTADALAEIMMGTATPTDPEDPNTPAVTTIKSADGKVSVTGNIPEGVYVEVISDGVALPGNFEGFGEQKFATFNIVLKNADGSIYEVKQTLVVSIAVPEGINGANSDVIYITEMGGTENMKAKYADGYMTFTTNHFSIYAIVERAAGDAGDHTETPGNTGAVAQAEGTASATGILAGIAAALTAAGAGVVAFRNARRNAKKNA